jgi:hypothetical protein
MKSFVALLFVCIVTHTLAQETELDRRNGFKDIKMAMVVDSVKGAKFKKDFKEKGHHEARLYTVEHADYQSIGEVKINSIELKTYKGFVYEILVVANKDTRLMKGMESALGKPTYNVRDESYNWIGQNLSLKFKSHSKNQLELRYASYVVAKMMQDDKKQKVEDISNDF